MPELNRRWRHLLNISFRLKLADGTMREQLSVIYLEFICCFWQNRLERMERTKRKTKWCSDSTRNAISSFKYNASLVLNNHLTYKSPINISTCIKWCCISYSDVVYGQHQQRVRSTTTMRGRYSGDLAAAAAEDPLFGQDTRAISVVDSNQHQACLRESKWPCCTTRYYIIHMAKEQHISST